MIRNLYIILWQYNNLKPNIKSKIFIIWTEIKSLFFNFENSKKKKTKNGDNEDFYWSFSNQTKFVRKLSEHLMNELINFQVPL